MADLPINTQKRISLLSLIESAAIAGASDLGEAYEQAVDVLERLTEDGYFKEERSGNGGGRSGGSRSGGGSRGGSSGRSRTSGGRGSSSSYSNKKPLQGEITEKQVAKILDLTDEYSEDDLWEMSKQEASDLIDNLIG